MNEVFNKLGVESGLLFQRDKLSYEELKFAKLIMQECVSVLIDRFLGDLNREDMEVRRCIEDINKHFKDE